METADIRASVSAGDRRIDSGGQVDDNDQTTPQGGVQRVRRVPRGRGLALPTEAECLDFVAERSGSRLTGLREPASSRHAQLARRPLILLMECLDGGFPQVGQATAPLVDRCPARFRAARDEYLAACRRRGNADASVATKQRAADLFLAYLDEVGRETLDEAEARDLAGFWARRQRRGYALKTTGSLRSALADFLRHLREAGQIREDLAGRLPPQRYPRRGESAPHPWTAKDVRLVLETRSTGNPRALLAEPDPATRRGLRDTVLLSTLYDTAARVQEICDLNTSDVRVARPMAVTLRGKGSKTRRVPLMDPTARLVRGLPQPARAPPRRRRRRRPAVQRAPTDPADPLGRHQVLARHVRSLRRRNPGYAAGVNVTPHVIRRTRAMHLLQAGVNLIYIRDLLGHADVSTTEIYARADTDAKRKAIESAYQSLTPEPLADWTADQDLLEWLDHACR